MENNTLKPIFIIHVPNSYLTNNSFEDIGNIAKHIEGYIVISVITSEDNFKFELFNPNAELQDIDIEAFKEKILNNA